MTLGKYRAAYLGLLGLTALTFGMSFLDLGALEWPIALGIAGTKGIIVALYFMHLIELSPAHRLAGFVAVVLLVTLILLALADVWTRPFDVGLEPFTTAVEDER